MTTYALTVNDRAQSVTVDYDDTPLLYVLRDDLGLKGTRFGCGDAQCGACTVLIDGRAEHSCDVPVSALAGRKVTTVEGLAEGDMLHAVQQAILDHQAGQCGYCLSGIVMKAVELVESGDPPDRERVKTHLADNLCRCGAQPRIVDAVEAAWRDKAEAPA